MGYAFLELLIGAERATTIRGIIELSIKNQDDDEFAEFFGLV